MRSNDWEAVPYFEGGPTDGPPGTAWTLAGGSGVDLYLLWHLRATHVCCGPVSPVPVTRIVATSKDRTDVWTERDRTEVDQSEIDEAADALLVESGLPGRPPARNWCLLLPDGWELETQRARWWADIYRMADPADGPRGERRAFERIFETKIKHLLGV